MKSPRNNSLKRPEDIDAIIFDLDGTLWDTCATCAVGWNNVLKRNEITFREITANDIRGVAGLPHDQCIRNVFAGLPEHQIKSLIADTETEDNVMVGKLGGDIYPGVADGLRDLASKFPLFIVSNCQSNYIETFFQWTGFTVFFKDFECWGNTGKLKGSNLRSVIDRNHLKLPVYVGDTEGDQRAAIECEVPFWYASYGFGRCSTYAKAFDNFNDLVSSALSF